MKLNKLFYSLFLLLIAAVACEEETINVDTKLNDETVALIEDEVIADINFSELLDEGDDGIFWGDAGFSFLKSAEYMSGKCPERTVDDQDDKRVITLEFSGDDCLKSGTIIIEYIKPGDSKKREKYVTYVDFVNRNGVLFNGTKHIVKNADNCKVEGEITTYRERDGRKVTIVRNYNRSVKWICGLDTRALNDNIKKVSGESEVTKTIVKGDESVVKNYKRKIIRPLLIVKACPFRIQAGVVSVEREDGTELKINYGEMPKNVECGFSTCNETLEVTKDGVTYTFTIDENGKRVRQADDQ